MIIEVFKGIDVILVQALRLNYASSRMLLLLIGIRCLRKVFRTDTLARYTEQD